MSTPRQQKKKKKKEKRSHAELDDIVPIEFTATASGSSAKSKVPAQPSFGVDEEFRLVNNGKQVLEDAEDSDHEVWMIQVPHNFDIRQLNDQMLLLQGEQMLNRSATASDSSTNAGDAPRYHSVATRIAEGEESTCHVLVPSDSVEGEFRGGACGERRCAGTIRILRSVPTGNNSPEDTIGQQPSRARKKTLPAGLHPRIKAFGSEQPTIVPRKHVRKALKVLHQDSSLVLSGDEDAFSTPKVKRRKKQKQ